jgi:hypothetical protein
MVGNGEEERETIRPEFDRSMLIDFQGAKITSDTGFLLVVKAYNGRGDVENRIKEGKNTLRWDKTSCHRFSANQARLLMGVLAYNLLHMLRRFYLVGEEVRRPMEWLIKRLIKVGARVAYHGRRWYVHVASAIPLARHYRAVFG